jgi:hypothetical protein
MGMCNGIKQILLLKGSSFVADKYQPLIPILFRSVKSGTEAEQERNSLYKPRLSLIPPSASLRGTKQSSIERSPFMFCAISNLHTNPENRD